MVQGIVLFVALSALLIATAVAYPRGPDVRFEQSNNEALMENVYKLLIQANKTLMEMQRQARLQDRYGYQARGMVGPSPQTQEHLLLSQQSRPVNRGDRTFKAGIEMLQRLLAQESRYEGDASVGGGPQPLLAQSGRPSSGGWGSFGGGK